MERMTFEELKEKLSELSTELMKAGFAHLFLSSNLNINELDNLPVGFVHPEMVVGSYANSQILALLIMEFLIQNPNVYKQIRAMVMMEVTEKIVEESYREEEEEQIDLGFTPDVPGDGDSIN